MDQSDHQPSTEIGHADADTISVRGKDLTDELMGEMDFTSYFYFHLTGNHPSDEEKQMVDAILVTLVDHGITPSVIAARSTHLSAPGSLQGAVASGILGAGSTYLGSMANTTALLNDGVEALRTTDTTLDEVAADIAENTDYVPGLGHPIHIPADPRTEALFQIAEDLDFYGDHVRLLKQIHSHVQEQTEKPVPINASGAIGAIIAEMELPANSGRGFSIVARTAGLIGHLQEEAKNPIGQDIWDLVDDTVEYTGDS